jgi:2-polyprenyl-3-methyl-5-hydroxy-6-metoxy-1,4-benzoquinol methylase
MLDVGCGSGLFLCMLAESGRIRAGYGVDRSRTAIRNARRIASEKGISRLLCFHTVNSLAEVPDTKYDVVSIIDVLHHIPKFRQFDFLIDTASKLRPGGTLIYKDISAKHMFWRLCNTFHDLVKAHELVNYVSEQRLLSAATEAGLEHHLSMYVRKLWYMHEIHILYKPFLPNQTESTDEVHSSQFT